MKRLIYLSLITIIICLTIYVFPTKAKQKEIRYQFETEKVFTKGICPDSIRASVYDSVTDKVLHYSFKNNANSSKEGFYLTVKASKKNGLVAGQITDCSLKTIAIISVGNKSAKTYKEELVIKLIK